MHWFYGNVQQKASFLANALSAQSCLFKMIGLSHVINHIALPAMSCAHVIILSFLLFSMARYDLRLFSVLVYDDYRHIFRCHQFCHSCHESKYELTKKNRRGCSVRPVDLFVFSLSNRQKNQI